MHPIRPALTHSCGLRLKLLLGVGLMATSRLSATLAPDDQALRGNPATIPVVEIAAAPSSPTHGGSNRDLLLSVTAILGLLVGMERLATWRVGVRHRRGALDVTSAFLPSRSGSATPEISPVAWRTARPRHRSSSHFPRMTPG